MGAIKLNPIKMAEITFQIQGTSPLIVHAWSEKAKRMMRMTPAERKKVLKVARNPEREAAETTYKTTSGKFGIPAMAFKSSLITVAHKDIGLEKTLLKKSMFVICEDANGVIPFSNKPKERVREDMVRVGMGSTDIRYRTEYTGWKIKVTVRVSYDALNEHDIANLVNLAGFGAGLCEWRPQKGGDFGRFEIDTNKEFKIKLLGG